MKKLTLPNVHPGEVLLQEFLKPLGLSQYRLAKALGIPESRVSEVVRGTRAVTADTALRLAVSGILTPVMNFGSIFRIATMSRRLSAKRAQKLRK